LDNTTQNEPENLERKHSTPNSDKDETAIEIGKLLFEWRDYTPIPLIILLLIVAKPSALSATLGIAMIIFGELIRVYSVAFIGSVSRTRSDSTGQALVTSGPFSYVRNPLYVGNFFITMGIAVFGGKAWFAVLTGAMFALQYYYIVKYEESLLLHKFGEAYQTYRQNVPPWIPRKRFSIEALEWPASFGPALKSEKRTLTAIIAIVAVLLFISAS
jgi:protein-S-isoprenylcysteine O-methyltransferase Ste14